MLQNDRTQTWRACCPTSQRNIYCVLKMTGSSQLLYKVNTLQRLLVELCKVRKWGENVLFFFFFQRLFIFGTERDRAWTGMGQRERETQNRKQAPASEPSAQSLTRGSNSRTARSWPGWSRTLNRLRHPGAPALYSILVIFSRLNPLLWFL